ncbi:hypothetical protein D477_009198 [Arthrobacter crystallopoietes BAB-32]|uniref:Uncharacterized protein n=1 Tax=Arthrobacter crystallopoietes BAB-32 TaxID=1246476 RepID=N1V3B6_9MICC|nr:hypothetical protein D477_009198 [Arthrobacter crystallopoietes BAB-32]
MVRQVAAGAASVLGGLLLAAFGVLAHRFRPFEGKDPGESCAPWGMNSASAAERDAEPFYLRQFFCSPDGSDAVLTKAPPEAFGLMAALLPLGLVLFAAGMVSLAMAARSPAAATVPPSGSSRRPAAAWALAMGAAWALFPSVAIYLGFGYWEAAAGYAGMVLACSAALIAAAESGAGGLGLRSAVARFAASAALAAAAAPMLAFGGGVFTLMAFAYPPVGGAMVVFPAAAALAWRLRRRAATT